MVNSIRTSRIWRRWTMEKLMAVPQYWNAPMYFYRKDLFEDPKNNGCFQGSYGATNSPFQPIGTQLVDIADFFNRPPNLYGGFVDGIAWASVYDYYNVLFGNGGGTFKHQGQHALCFSTVQNPAEER